MVASTGATSRENELNESPMDCRIDSRVCAVGRPAAVVPGANCHVRTNRAISIDTTIESHIGARHRRSASDDSQHNTTGTPSEPRKFQPRNSRLSDAVVPMARASTPSSARNRNHRRFGSSRDAGVPPPPAR